MELWITFGRSSGEFAFLSVNDPIAVRVSWEQYAPVPSISPISRASDRMYVPVLHVTEICSVGYLYSSKIISCIVIGRGFLSTLSPARAYSYIFLPLILIAAYAGGIWDVCCLMRLK